MEALVIFSDILIVTIFVFYLIKALFGDNPLGRILSVLGSVGTFFISGNIFVWANSGYLNYKIALIILFGPIAIFLLLMLLIYAFDGNTNTKNQERKSEVSSYNIKKSKKFRSKLVKIKDNIYLDDDETLIYENEIFNLRKNIFVAETGKLKLTDRNIIWYNHKKNIRIPMEGIKSITYRNYLIFIPTGIQITTSNKKYDFITMNRKDILKNINKYMV